jgi:hypothetical protein
VVTRGLGRRGTALAMTVDMTITSEQLVTVCGGNQQQAQLRAMAQRWCPRTYARYANQPVLTRGMGEQCLDEAGLSQYRSQLDRYFPRR